MDGDAQRIRIEMMRSPIGDLIVERLAHICTNAGKLRRIERVAVVAVIVDMDGAVLAGQRQIVLADDFALEAAKQQDPIGRTVVFEEIAMMGNCLLYTSDAADE